MNIRLYSDKVEIYDSAHYSHGEANEELSDILSWFKKTKARVLDLGCGTGLHAVTLARKGFRVVGVDSSGEALLHAAQRSEGVTGISFRQGDLEDDDLSSYGIQDLVISLGNTMSHLSRTRLIEIFANIRRVLAPGGSFVFNTLYWAHPFQKSVVERDPDDEVSIIWERKLNEEKGTILLNGHFVKEDFTQTIEVQCYKVPEITNLLKLAGFGSVRWSTRLDFKNRTLAGGVNTVYYKVTNPLNGGR